MNKIMFDFQIAGICQWVSGVLKLLKWAQAINTINTIPAWLQPQAIQIEPHPKTRFEKYNPGA